MQLAPITTITQVRHDAAALAAASRELEQVVSTPFRGGARVDDAMRARLGATMSAADDVLRTADAASTSAVTWERDARLGVAAQQVREGVEELYDVVHDAVDSLREASGAATLPDDIATGPIYDLRKAAVQLHGFSTDLVQTIDALV